jgi:hypothetical protein
MEPTLIVDRRPSSPPPTEFAAKLAAKSRKRLCINQVALLLHIYELVAVKPVRFKIDVSGGELRSLVELVVTWVEDRATVGTDLSAVPGAKTGARARSYSCLALLVCLPPGLA